MKKIIKWFLLIAWIFFIFYMSNQVGNDSSNTSGFFIRKLIELFPNINFNIELLSFIIRKLAHIFEYFVLGILVIMLVKEYKLKNIFLVSILICIFLACFDEIHQLFVPGRESKLIDVLYDSIGFILSIVLLMKIKYKKY